MVWPTFPLRPTVKPDDLDGVTNGNVPAHLLVDVGRRGSKMHHTAARGWRCLMAHAEAAGFRWDLASIDPRTYEQQVAAFDGSNPAKWTGVLGRYVPEEQWATAPTSFTTDIRTWQNKRWKRRVGTAAAAVPGTSPHGWALAADLAEQTDDDPAAEGITQAFAEWLVADDIALKCGFGWSLQDEPWHLTWFYGDVIPPFVAAWENPPVKPLPPSPIVEDDDMTRITVIKVADSKAEFWGFMLDGVAPTVQWSGNGADPRVQAKMAQLRATPSFQELKLSVDDLKNVTLIGPAPTGDTNDKGQPRTWGRGNFFAWLPGV